MSYVYLASPYSHPSPFVREWRYLAAMRHVLSFLQRGEWIYSPIVHCHELAKIVVMPKDAHFWRDYNFAMLRQASKIVALMLPGYIESVGVKEELSEATRLHLVTEFQAPEQEIL